MAVKKRIILRNGQCPGDLVMLAYAIKALMEQYPGRYLVDVRSPCPEIFYHSPHLTPLDDQDIRVKTYEIGYPTVHQSNQRCYHFANSFTHELGRLLHLPLEPTEFQDCIYISQEEASWYSAVYEILGKDVPYWVVDAGHKLDYTCKAWDFRRYQEIIDRFPELTFVQIGVNHSYHVHPELTGKNLINLVGKTDLRQLIRLIFNAFGVLTPVSSPMVLSYAVPAHPRFGRQSRACIVVAGAREPNHWQQGPNQQYLHSNGQLPCTGCWKSRVVPLNLDPKTPDNKDTELCLYPIELPTGQVIPKCMDLISVDEVCLHIKKYMDNLK